MTYRRRQPQQPGDPETRIKFDFWSTTLLLVPYVAGDLRVLTVSHMIALFRCPTMQIAKCERLHLQPV